MARPGRGGGGGGGGGGGNGGGGSGSPGGRPVWKKRECERPIPHPSPARPLLTTQVPAYLLRATASPALAARAEPLLPRGA